MTEKGFLKSQSVEWLRRNIHFTCVSRREKDHAGLQDQQEKIWQEKCDYLVNHAQECESKKRSEEEAASAYNVWSHNRAANKRWLSDNDRQK